MLITIKGNEIGLLLKKLQGVILEHRPDTSSPGATNTADSKDMIANMDCSISLLII